MTSKASSSLVKASVRTSNHAPNSGLPRSLQKRRLTTTILSDDPAALPVQPFRHKLPKIPYRIQTAILLNRSPILSRPETSFESALYEYNARIARALSNPFPYQFYFKPGSPLEKQFRKEEEIREQEAFNWGVHFDGQGKVIKDTKVVPTEEKEQESSGNVDLSQGIEMKETEEALMPRITQADIKKDVKSLDRKGERNLYLLIKKNGDGSDWRLPGEVNAVVREEYLHLAAERELRAECGTNMDAWIVGRRPIGFMDNPLPPNLSDQYAGSKTFFFKAHILAGQVDTAAGSLADFAWLTKKEIKRTVTPEYWKNIRDILSDF